MTRTTLDSITISRGIMTFRITTLGRMTVSIKALGIMTFRITTLVRMTVSI